VSTFVNLSVDGELLDEVGEEVSYLGSLSIRGTDEEVVDVEVPITLK
jgi:hypothetical protein